MNTCKRVFLLSPVMLMFSSQAMEIEQHPSHETTKELIERTKEPGRYNYMPQKYLDLCPSHGPFDARKIYYSAWSWDDSTLAILQYPYAEDNQRLPLEKAQLTVIDPKCNDERGRVIYNIIIPKHKYAGLAISPEGKKYAAVGIDTHRDQYKLQVITKMLMIGDMAAQQNRNINLPVLVRAVSASYRPNFNKQETKVIVHEEYMEDLPHGSALRNDIMILPIDDDKSDGLILGEFPCEQKMTRTKLVTELIGIEEEK